MPGDTICLVTDGVMEAMNPKAEAYGRRRFEALLEQVGRAASAAEMGEAIRLDVSRFADGAEQSDDMAILSSAARAGLSLTPRGGAG